MTSATKAGECKHDALEPALERRRVLKCEGYWRVNSDWFRVLFGRLQKEPSFNQSKEEDLAFFKIKALGKLITECLQDPCLSLLVHSYCIFLKFSSPVSSGKPSLFYLSPYYYNLIVSNCS